MCCDYARLLRLGLLFCAPRLAKDSFCILRLYAVILRRYAVLKVIGYQRSQFKAKDNSDISGYFIFLSEEKPTVVGIETFRIFVSDRKLGSYLPNLGDDLRVLYNRYGKVDSVELLC